MRDYFYHKIDYSSHEGETETNLITFQSYSFPRRDLMFAVLHKHGPAECPAKSEQQLFQFADAVSDKSAATHSVKVIQRFVDTKCTGTISGHLFGTPVHHAILIVESDNEQNVQGFVEKISCEIVGIKSLSQVLPKK